MIEPSITKILHGRLGEEIEEYLIPPPVFELMHGEFLSIDLDSNLVTTRFPVLPEYQNPYHTMQGGMVATAVDNTLGPLSMLVAPPNVTRRLEMKYSHPITNDIEYITVEGKLLKQDGSWLTFRAEVRDPEGNLMARARSFHWIIDENQDK